MRRPYGFRHSSRLYCLLFLLFFLSQNREVMPLPYKANREQGAGSAGQRIATRHPLPGPCRLGRRGPIVRNKPNLPDAEIDANHSSIRGLGEEHADMAPEKTKPIARSGAPRRCLVCGFGPRIAVRGHNIADCGLAPDLRRGGRLCKTNPIGWRGALPRQTKPIRPVLRIGPPENSARQILRNKPNLRDAEIDANCGSIRGLGEEGYGYGS
jgi:hypothetical protein